MYGDSDLTSCLKDELNKMALGDKFKLENLLYAVGSISPHSSRTSCPIRGNLPSKKNKFTIYMSILQHSYCYNLRYI